MTRQADHRHSLDSVEVTIDVLVPDFGDDEVALLHGDGPPWAPVTEPLVHYRSALDHLCDVGLVQAADSREVSRSLKQRWFGDRSIPLFLELLVAKTGDGARKRIAAELRAFERFRVKNRDLADFLEQAPWRNSRC